VTILSIYEQMILSGELVPATGATGVFPDPCPPNRASTCPQNSLGSGRTGSDVGVTT
jgi:hypothetical protein